MATNKYPVALTILPGFEHLELVQLDDETGDIRVATSLPCAIDPTNRQVINEDAFGQTVKDLYEGNGIPLSTPAVLVLPNFFSRDVDLPTDFTKEELKFALISEAERFYIFKNIEPEVAWITMSENSGKYFFSAYAKDEIEKYQDIFDKVKVPLAAIEMGYLSALRGLVATHAVGDEVDNDSVWALMIITQSSFFLALMQGNQMTKTTDSPISVTPEDADATMSDIQQDLEFFLDGELYSKLVVVNNTKEINVEQLVQTLNLSVPVVPITQNIETLVSAGGQGASFPCSLEGVGGVFFGGMNQSPAMNFKPKASMGSLAVTDLRKYIFILLVVLNVFAVIGVGLFYLYMDFSLKGKKAELDKVQQQANQGANVQDVTMYKDLQRKLFITDIQKANRVLNTGLVKVGSQVDTNAWLEKISANVPGAGAMPVFEIQGHSLTPDAADQLSSSLKESITELSFQIQTIDNKQSPHGQSYYYWTIVSTVSENQAPAAVPVPNSGPGGLPGRGGAPFGPPGGP